LYPYHIGQVVLLGWGSILNFMVEMALYQFPKRGQGHFSLFALCNDQDVMALLDAEQEQLKRALAIGRAVARCQIGHQDIAGELLGNLDKLGQRSGVKSCLMIYGKSDFRHRASSLLAEQIAMLHRFPPNVSDPETVLLAAAHPGETRPVRHSDDGLAKL
jgi:hypothetical protein